MNDTRKKFISRTRFTEARKKRGLTITDIADAINVPYETLRQCIRNQRIMPDHLEAICLYMNVSPRWLQEKEGSHSTSNQHLEIVKGNSESIAVLNEVLPAIDDEGQEIPTYYDYQSSDRVQNIEESMFLFLDKVIRSGGWSEDFFYENYDAIIDIFAPSIDGLSRYIHAKTGKFVILNALKRKRG